MDTSERTGNHQDDRHLELELKLLVHDSAVFDEILPLTQLAGFPLQAAPTRAIRDLYWDTPDGAVSAARVNLRLRVEDEQEKLTLKWFGNIQRGLAQRNELEVAADATGLQAVARALAQEGVSLPLPAGQEPATSLSRAGLRVTQDRSTSRAIRYAERNGRKLVELALDTTTYHLGIYEVTVREIEAEAIEGSVTEVLAIGRALQQTFPGRLSPSKDGKYARGLELARRLSANSEFQVPRSKPQVSGSSSLELET